MGTDGDDAGRWGEAGPGPSPTPREGSRLAVGVVSAGRVGAVLGAALANAGHTVTSGGQTFKLNLLPSGVLHPGTVSVLGDGMVIGAGIPPGGIAPLPPNGGPLYPNCGTSRLPW